MILPPNLELHPPKMTLYPLISKGGAFVLKLGLVFRKTTATLIQVAVVFFVWIFLWGIRTMSNKKQYGGLFLRRGNERSEAIGAIAPRQPPSLRHIEKNLSYKIGSFIFCISSPPKNYTGI